MREADVSEPAAQRPEASRPRGVADRGGILVLDKPPGPTSHDLVARGRRALNTRAVGHAGTLDPAATGVLVLLFGEGTKLASYLTASAKRYDAVIQLGTLTDTLDGEGAAVASAPVPDFTPAQAASALASFLGQHTQEVPLVSAVKVAGQPLHRRVRRGEQGLEAPVREVILHDVALERCTGTQLHVSLSCSKGFYVRSFARDVAERMGTLGHVSALRRTQSGHLTLNHAAPVARFEEAVQERRRERLRPWILSLEDAWTGVTVPLSLEGVEDANHGRAILPDRLLRPNEFADLQAGSVCALADGRDHMMVALGRVESDTIRIARGLRRET